MIASWMLYCALCALGLSIAAVLAERALLAGRAPVRAVWFTAVLLSFLMPAVALRYASRPQPVSVASSAREGAVLDASTVLASADSPPVVGAAPAPSPQLRRFDLRAMVARADRPLTIAWLALSAALALYFLGGVAALTFMRRGWRRRTVLGVPVLVSERTGPALVGAMSPAIVLPQWALEMEPKQLALMLLHEEEHRRARDGQLLTVAHVALVAMPWNVALWWQVWRLRMAVELDCDARVLRDADARSYGDLLLEVVRPGRGLRLMGATAFVDRAAQLERRIRVLTRRRERAVRGARAAVVIIGLATLTVAWVAPRPLAPARSSVAPLAPHALNASPNVEQPKVVVPSRDIPKRVELPAITRVAAKDSASHAVAPMRGDTMITILRDSGAVAQFFHQLFDGIALTASQESAARALLGNLERQELDEQVSRVSTLMRSLSARQALQTERDSALRSLITSDDDRTLFDSRIAVASMGGGRDSAEPSQRAAFGAEDATFHRLFDGITLSPAGELAARVIIATHQEAQQTLIPPVTVYLETLSPGVVTMQAESQAAFLSLLTNDSHRYLLQSRIVAARPQPRTPQL